MTLTPFQSPEFDLFNQLEANFNARKVGIVEFAESSEFCSRILYPRQRLLLKLFFLEDLTDEEDAILDHWEHGGRNGSEIQISSGIRERTAALKQRGFKHFREIVLVGGRRCSKGFITGLTLAKLVFDMLQLQDPGQYYGIDADKEIIFGCVAASQDQAKQMQYADFSSMVNSCKAMQRHIFKLQELEFSLMTESDMRKVESWKRQNRRVQRDISKIRGRALPANSRSIRGMTAMALVFDEFAHFQQGESDQSDAEVYAAATPALSQFREDGMIFCNPPEAPLWMGDLSFKPIGDVQVGDRVVGWSRPSKAKHHDLCEARVTQVSRREAPLVKVTMASGRTFRCTADHLWLTPRSGGQVPAKKTGYYKQANEWYSTPRPGRKLIHVVDPTPPLADRCQRDAAWLGGLWDGEGYAARAKQLTVCQSRTVNPLICNEIERVLDRLGFDWRYHLIKAKLGLGGAYHVLGSRQMVTDFANWTQPVQRHKLVAKALTGRWRTTDEIVSVEPDGYGEVVALTTTTGNYVCNGFASKNCNSSPFSKVGRLYERYEAGMAMENGAPADPSILALRFPSWALYEGWWEDPGYVGPKKCITVSPDWDLDAKKADDSFYYTETDRNAIIIARAQEKDNPVKYKVEHRGLFAETIDAYLMPEMVDRMFQGRPVSYSKGVDQWSYAPFKTNWDDSTYMLKYYAHLDPSSTTAGFGFAMGHTEDFTLDNRTEQHVVFDIVKRWDPKDFRDHTIDWDPILDWVTNICYLFRPVQLTMDQYNSAYPITWLRRKFREKRIETRVFEKTATAQTNWDRAEIFRTALYRGLIHAPADTTDCLYCGEELKFLREIKTGKIPRVEKQDTGPIQTKDLADCVMTVTEVTIGDLMAAAMRRDLQGQSVQSGAPGGYQIGGNQLGRGSQGTPMANFYGHRSGEQRIPIGARNPSRVDPTRRAAGGRPIPRRLPGW